MQIGKALLIVWFLFYFKETSSFHGCITKCFISSANYTERRIVDYQISKLILPTYEKYFVFIHDDTRKSYFDNREWYDRLRKVLLSKYPMSIILEFYWNWNKIIFTSPSADDVRKVATDLLFFFNSLVDNSVEPAKIVIFGHGYGALIGSVTAKSFEKVHGVKIGRLVAMDPDETMSIFAKNFLYVTKNDASVVMAIHTLSGPHSVPAGSIEFFPNGGYYQPGCYLFINLCGNTRSHEYLISAVSYPDHFKAYKCDSFDNFKRGICNDNPVSLGDLETKDTGSFFLETHSKAPYFND